MHASRPLSKPVLTRLTSYAFVLVVAMGLMPGNDARAQVVTGKLEHVPTLQAQLKPQERLAHEATTEPQFEMDVEVDTKPDPVTAAPFRWTNEELYYSVRINGAEAMRAGVRTGAPRVANNRPYVPISGTARSTGFFHSIYPLDDRANTFMNPNDKLPWRSEKHFEEKGTTRGYNVTYEHASYDARVERRHNERVSNFSAPIPAGTHDMLTWAYDLRAQEDIEIGRRYSYYIYDGWLLSRLDLHVVAKEDVYTPMGWFKAWKIDFSREIMGTRRGPIRDNVRTEPIVRVREPARHRGSFWVSRDENHIPIKVAINTFFGVGEAVLIRYKPANQ